MAGHVLNDARGVVVEVEAPPRRSSASSRGCRSRRRRSRWSSGSPPEPVEELGERGFSIRESPAGRRAARRGHAGQRHLRRLPAPSCSIPATGASATRSSTARTAGRASRSCAASRTTGRNTTMAGVRDVPGLPRRVRRPGRPPLPRPAERLPGVRAAGAARVAGGGAVADRRRDAVEAAAARCSTGAIVAVKGIGGFHLACRADDEAAVGRAARAQAPRGQAVRADGARPRGGAASWSSWAARRRSCWLDRARPIVLAPAAAGRARWRPRSRRARAELGVMLPYSPLHHLLLADAGATLVMTSGNVSDEPIAFRDEDALERLARHRGPVPGPRPADRDPHRRLASCARRAGEPAAAAAALARLRAGRAAAARSDCGGQLLACGAELKNTFCRRQGRARLGGPPRRRPQELRDAALVRRGHRPLPAAVRGRAARSSPTTCTPSTCRPSTRSSSTASSRSACSTTTRTSRRAWPSTASWARRSARSSTAPATATDGTVWGGELLFGDLRGFERAGLLFPVRMPGGEAAIRQPWRMACAWLAAALDDEPPLPSRSPAVDRGAWAQVAELARSGVASPLTTSVGPAVRRRRRALRRARRGQLRGPGGGRARGRAATPPRTARYPLPLRRRRRRRS